MLFHLFAEASVHFMRENIVYPLIIFVSLSFSHFLPRVPVYYLVTYLLAIFNVKLVENIIEISSQRQ